MARGSLKVRINGREETVFHVHRWPHSGHSYVCSSTCAHRERGTSFELEWSKPDDGPEIRTRLAGKPGQLSGAAKGRVLFVIERRPLGGGLRVAAAALTSVEPQVLKLYRLCFSAEVLRAQRPSDAAVLVSCARALAASARRPLHMLTPPSASPGDVAAQFNFTGGTVKDRLGQVWLR